MQTFPSSIFAKSQMKLQNYACKNFLLCSTYIVYHISYITYRILYIVYQSSFAADVYYTDLGGKGVFELDE